MGRILAIDFGIKRVGLAVTDPLQIIASPLTTVSTAEAEKFITDYISSESVEKIVIGLPVSLQNEATDATQPVLDFIKKLEKKVGTIPIITVDERFTSKIATDAILMSGAKKKQRSDKKLIDKVSASLILQTYLGI